MKSLKTFLFILTLFIINSCSKDVEGQINDNNVITETVSNFQLVSIDIEQENFSQNEYTSEIGGIQINIAIGLDNKLHFMIPGNLSEGNYNFQLNTIKRKFIVKKPILTETAENTIQPFRNQINNLLPALDNSNESVVISNNINGFNNAYNNLSAEQKDNLALFYKVNKNWFDFIIADDYSRNYNGRFTDNVNSELIKSMVGVSVFTIGIVGVYYGSAEIKLLGIVACAISWKSVTKAIKRIHNEGFKTINLMMDGEVSELNRNALTAISFQSETEKIINFNTKDRKIIASDSNNATNKLFDFFNMFNNFNLYIDKGNFIINSLNNLPFINLPLFTKFQLPTDSPTLNNTMIPEIFNRINFSIDNSNLNLQSVSFINGQLKIKIKNNSNNVISDYLKYTFSDGFSTFSGKFPIIVQLTQSFNTLVGNWNYYYNFQGNEFPYNQWFLFDGNYQKINGSASIISNGNVNFQRTFSWYNTSTPNVIHNTEVTFNGGRLTGVLFGTEMYEVNLSQATLNIAEDGVQKQCQPYNCVILLGSANLIDILIEYSWNGQNYSIRDDFKRN